MTAPGIVPQDGNNKQDCEINAGKRWLDNNGAFYNTGNQQHFLTFCDDAYRLIRATLHTRQTFFDHVRCLTCYHCFSSWAAMMDFMMRGLEIGPYATQEA